MAQRQEWLDPVFVSLTYAGTHGAAWIAIGVLVALWLRRPWPAVAVPLAVLVAELASAGLKSVTDRARPPEGLGVDSLVPTPSTSAFPSGHAATSMAAAVVLAVAAPALAPVFLSLAALVGVSRLYVGVHYPLDVVAGAMLGACLATALLLLARALRRSSSPPRPGLPTAR